MERMRSALARKLISELHSFYNQHRQLIEAYVINFHLEKHWERCVPHDWRQFFDKCLIECADQLPAYLASLLEHEKVVSFAQCANVEVPQSLRDTQCRLHDFSQQMRQLSDEGGFTAEPTRLHSNYRVKAKKQHEIVRLSAALHQLHSQCRETPSVLVDVGGGVGHLARQLSNDHSFVRIVTVDAEPSLTHTAQQFTRNQSKNIEHINKKLELTDDARVALIDNEHESYCLVGLHTCGDLASTILRHFVECSQVRSLVSVGCCYHKLNSGRDHLYGRKYSGGNVLPGTSSTNGYPMSVGCAVSYTARDLACYAVDYMRNRLCEANSYRAALEYCLLQVDSDNERHRKVNSVKVTSNELGFVEYCRQALKGQAEDAHVEQIIHYAQENEESINEKLREGARIVIFYALRQMLAPVVENIILLDRLIYLLDSNCVNAYIWQLFDAKISPRCWALVAYK